MSDGSKYPDWFKIPCSTCGKILDIFCFTRKDYKVHPHFCDGPECLTAFYSAKPGVTKVGVTVARLLSMRHNRNQRVTEYLKDYDDSGPFDEPSKPITPDALLVIRQRDQDYRKQLRKHRGLSV